MKDLSDIEDGFAVKRRRETAKARGNKGKNVRGKDRVGYGATEFVQSRFSP